MKKDLRDVAIVVIVVGALLILVGIFLKVPHKELTTYSILSEEYSVIEEYVGGDAYNYIIGASLVGGEIAGVKAQKAVFISIGVLISCIGLLTFAYCYADAKTINDELKSEEPNSEMSTDDKAEEVKQS